MKPKTMILMVVAVVCGLGASYMTSRLLAEREEPAAPPPPEKVTVLVAKKTLPMHTALGLKPEDLFVERSFAKEDAPQNAFTMADKDKLKKKFLKYTVKQGQAITVEDLMDNNFGLKTLENGKRAVGIRVSVEAIAGGFASLPGSHVDLIWTTRENGNGAIKTFCLLEDVVVLAADTSQLTPAEGGALPASVVTVALSPDDTLKVTQAMATGTLSLVLRNLEDGKKILQQPKDQETVVAADQRPSTDPIVRDQPKFEPVNPNNPDPKQPLVADPKQQPDPKQPQVTQDPKQPQVVKDPKQQPDPKQPQVTQDVKQPHPKHRALADGQHKFTVTVWNGEEKKQHHVILDANNNYVRPWDPSDEIRAEEEPLAEPPAGKEKKS